MVEVIVGSRVRVDSALVRMSFPKDRTGQLSPEGVRATRVFEKIVDATGFAPFVTEVRDTEVELANNYFGEEMSALRVPAWAVVGVVQAPVLSVRLSHVPNPDIEGGYWDADGRDGACERVVGSLGDAAREVREYIYRNRLGGGNWAGAAVMSGDVQVAKISYNGRVFGMDGAEVLVPVIT